MHSKAWSVSCIRVSFTFGPEDNEKDLLQPAIKGCVSMLDACCVMENKSSAGRHILPRFRCRHF